MFLRLLRSDSLRSAIGFGAGGIGFAAGNIILARVLSPDSFGVVALALALNQFGLTFGPWGLDVVANRHRPRVGWRLVRLVSSTSVLAGCIVAMAAAFYYHLSARISLVIFAMTVGSAINRVGAALFQGGENLRASLMLSQVHNYILLLIAIVTLYMTERSELFVVCVVSVGYLLSAVVGWWLARRSLNAGRTEIDAGVALREGAAVLGIGVAVEVLGQFERLAIPKVGTLGMLSTYAVIAAVAGSSFRMLQIGTSFSLLPRLRAAASAQAARNVLWREATTTSLVAAVAAIAIALLSPLLFKLVLHDKYDIPSNLIIAAIVVGLAKLWEGFSVAVVSACGSTRALALFSVFAWVCLGLAALGSFVGSRFGLVGILYGVGVAWALLAAGGTYLARVSFRARFAALAAHPI
jgi:O-antigen/teichoic acid export membrane protein